MSNRSSPPHTIVVGYGIVSMVIDSLGFISFRKGIVISNFC